MPALQAAQEKLASHREIWLRKPLLRRLYQEYYRRLVDMLPLKATRVVELGGGSGNLKGSIPTVISTDLVFCSWLDAALDAQAMPFTENRIDAFVGVDVLHHIEHPLRFFREAERCLCPGGRILLVDPFVSPLSYVVFKLFHSEPLNMSQDFFGAPSANGAFPKDSWDANLAMATVLFWRERAAFQSLFPRLRIIHLETFDWVWPLSGGFSYPALVPERWGDWLCRIGRWKLANSVSAFHTLVAIEKIA